MVDKGGERGGGVECRYSTVETQFLRLRAQTSTLLTACTAMSLGLGGLLAWLLARSITRPLRQAESMAQAIAAMDLTGAPQSKYAKDEMERQDYKPTTEDKESQRDHFEVVFQETISRRSKI